MARPVGVPNGHFHLSQPEPMEPYGGVERSHDNRSKMLRMSDLVFVGTFDSEPEAELARGALLSAGIDAIIQADTIGGMRPHVAMMGAGYRLLVRKEDATDAWKVLDARAPRKEFDLNTNID